MKCPGCGYISSDGRSTGQRGYYWALMLPMIAEKIGESDLDEVNQYMKLKFNPKVKTVNGEEIIYGGSIEKESKARIEEIYTQIRTWAYHFLNLSIPLPNEIPIE